MSFATLVAEERAQGRDLLDRLHDLWAEVGLWVSSQYSVGRTGPTGQEEITSAVEHLAAKPPERVGGHQVVAVIDYRKGAGHRPIWLGEQDLIELDLGNVGRVLVRPSGTEPKIKVYVDLQGEPGTSPDESYRRLTASAAEMAKEVGEGLAF